MSYLFIENYTQSLLKIGIVTGFIQQGSPVGAQQRPPNHIIARPQIPGTPIQWMQQQVTSFLYFLILFELFSKFRKLEDKYIEGGT